MDAHSVVLAGAGVAWLARAERLLVLNKVTVSAPVNLWVLWIVFTCAACALFAYKLWFSEDKSVFMPGPLSAGHHQLMGSCDSCHTDAFGGGEVIQQSCIDCHGEDRKKPFDSHPIAKFQDPRNADRLEMINATQCITCHTEHRPEITQVNGLTQPKDICLHCHADIGTDRPSHTEFKFTDCTNSGCHNYHDNRALYTDFLTKHMDAPDYTDHPAVMSRDFASVIDQIPEYPVDRFPIVMLSNNDSDMPQALRKNISNADEIHKQWSTTAHANSGVNCSACHQTVNDEGVLSEWQDKPGIEGCATCHNTEADHFMKGKHGMRLAAGLSPMTPASAKLPMNPLALDNELTCNSCHNAHSFSVQQAAVESCLSCHADDHSLAYKDSPHYQTWLAELEGTADKNTGVSCATCHMPRVDLDVSDWLSRPVVMHNQSATLAPNSKMIRPACMNCHGLGFSIDALADTALIKNNFTGTPQIHVESIDLARQDLERYLKEKEAASQ